MALKAVKKPTPATTPQSGETFDLIVIGAGINGIGIARDAALRGLKVALVEREDIGSGTSNASGRLIHGGLRYLEQGDLRLVRESLRERERLFRLAPHLVKPVPMIMPLYKRNSRPSLMIRAGMIAYDILSWDKSTARHSHLSRAQTLARCPSLDPEGLKGAVVFMDGQVVWSERLCVEVALSAQADGVKIFTHSVVDGFVFEGERISGVRYSDTITGLSGSLTAKIVVNAAGPWVDAVLSADPTKHKRYMGGTKGSHLVVEPFKGAPRDTIYYESVSDGRLVWVVPWGKRYMIGCTDKRFEGDPKDARADQSEASYLLESTNRLLPGANLTLDSVVYAFSGIRPLPYVPDKAEWNVPRSHVIHDHAPERPGLLSIIGGKLTTYRSLAEETVDIIFQKLQKKSPKCSTASILLPGAPVGDGDSLRKSLLQKRGLSPLSVDRLLGLYGSRANLVVAVADSDPSLLEPLSAGTDAIGAEIIFAYANEFARTLTDILLRRTMVGFEDRRDPKIADRAADILKARYKWARSRRDSELADFRRHAERYSVALEPTQESKASSKLRAAS